MEDFLAFLVSLQLHIHLLSSSCQFFHFFFGIQHPHIERPLDVAPATVFIQGNV